MKKIGKEEVISKPEENSDTEAYFNANKHRVTKTKEPVRRKPSIIHASTHLEPRAFDFATYPVVSPQTLKEERKIDKRNVDKEQEMWKSSKYSSSLSTNIDSPQPRIQDQPRTSISHLYKKSVPRKLPGIQENEFKAK